LAFVGANPTPPTIKNQKLKRKIKNMDCCDIWQIFNEKENLIKEYKYWKLLIRNRNTTLGNCVAILKRHIEHFSEINTEEMSEFTKVVKNIEESLKKSFNYDKINYLILMMKDKHLHFHIIPRYLSPRNFVSTEWVDDEWPKPTIRSKMNVSKEELEQIKNEILKNWPS
jgi:diadenosine tetraphosphate (Ap4A) HIT family hydrolase